MGKKRVFCLLALAVCLGLAGCSPVKTINKVWRGEEVSSRVQIVYRIVSQDPTKEEIEDTAYKLLMRAKSYNSGASVESRGEDRLIVSFPSEVEAEELAEELAVPGELNFITEDGAVVLNGGNIASAEVDAVQTRKSDPKDEDETDAEDYVIKLKFTEAGTRIFSEVTQDNIGKHISIVYDGKLICSPVVNAAIISGEASITGIGSKKETERLARMIRIGGLSLELELYEIVRE